ncbi:MAG TPA: 4Fe-4S binding protein [Sedimentibacter sp.]|nr:4Fe-4S binding protein [Sedimentibacter sp.]HOG63479.1 4Fe-4S binding protein [Sedimentibacter sp.]HPX00494.1 4Fe-4S binding protein [Sedimentibacter sp.]
MAKIIISENLCKGCSLCVTQCPKNIIKISNKINSKGYTIAEQTDDTQCTGCTLCAIVCPDSAIEVYK